MRSLEEITRDIFTTYSEAKIGRKVPWHLLSEERQIEWMEDSYLLIKEVLEELLKEIDLKVPDRDPSAAFGDL